MPDISKCTGNNCPIRENCYRYTSTPHPFRQSWMMEVPYNEKENNCEFKIIRKSGATN